MASFSSSDAELISLLELNMAYRKNMQRKPPPSVSLSLVCSFGSSFEGKALCSQNCGAQAAFRLPPPSPEERRAGFGKNAASVLKTGKNVSSFVLIYETDL